MISNLFPRPKEELKAMVKEFTLDQLYDIAREAYPDCIITKEQIQKEIDELD